MSFIATEQALVFPRIMMLGGHGTGKTHLCGLFHEMYKKYCGTKGLFHGDFDTGWITLRSQGFDVTVEKYVDADPMNPTAWARYCEDTEKFTKSSDGFSAVSGDSFTTMQDCLMNDIIKFNELKGRRKYRHVYLTTENDYGVFERTVTNDFFPEFTRMCEHVTVILTCHTQEYAAEGEPTRIHPKVKGKALSGSIIGIWFNEVIYLKVVGSGENAERRIQTVKDFKIDLKTQTKGMPGELSYEEYVFRVGVAYGSLKGGMIDKYAKDKNIDIKKLKNFEIPKFGEQTLEKDNVLKNPSNAT